MAKLGHIELYVLLIQLICLLGVSKFFGELARRFKQPAVIGEIIGGIIIGPSLLGKFAPSLFHSVFLNSRASAVALDGMITISVIFLLFFVGLEIKLDSIKQQGKAIATFGALGVAVPFALGYPIGWILYPNIKTSLTHHVFSMFMGSALSISALLVIARVLLDLNLLESKIGTVNGSSRITPQIKESINMFTIHILAPLFFAAVGLKVNFFSSFDIRVVLIVLAAAYVSKISAGWVGGWITGLSKNERMAVGFGIAARGGMGIILSIIAFDAHLIDPKLFTALVIMALMTSVTSSLVGRFVSTTQQNTNTTLDLKPFP